MFTVRAADEDVEMLGEDDEEAISKPSAGAPKAKRARKAMRKGGASSSAAQVNEAAVEVVLEEDEERLAAPLSRKKE